RTAQLTIGILVWILLVPVSFFVRQAPGHAAKATPAGAQLVEPRIGVSEALRSTPFIVLALTFFACCAAHSGPIFHTISYAIGCGLPATTAVTIYSVEGLSGSAGASGWGCSQTAWARSES